MQNVSPGTENKEAGRDVAEGNTIKNHVTVPGVVNVEQKHSAPGDLLSVGWKAKAGTGQPEYRSAKGGAAA
jgi:hypothetical protein